VEKNVFNAPVGLNPLEMHSELSETLLTALRSQRALRCLDNRSEDEATLSVSSAVKRFVSLSFRYAL